MLDLRKSSHWLKFAPALAWAILIFWASAQPRPLAPPGVYGLDKVAHVGVYGILTWLLLFGDRWPRGWRVAFWVLVASTYGLLDEVHQSYVPRREGSGYDWLADCIGAVMVASWQWRRRRRSLRSATSD